MDLNELIRKRTVFDTSRRYNDDRETSDETVDLTRVKRAWSGGVH